MVPNDAVKNFSLWYGPRFLFDPSLDRTPIFQKSRSALKYQIEPYLARQKEEIDV